MDTKSDEQLLVIGSTIEANTQEADKNRNETNKKLTLLTDNLQFLTALMTDNTNISKSSPAQKDTLTPPYPTTVVLTNNRAPSLEEEQYTKFCGMWTLKHEIS